MGDEHNWTVELGLIGEPTTEEKYQAALKRLGEYHDHVLDLEKQLSELEAVVKCCEDEEETEICFLKDVPGFWDAWIANKPKGYAMLEYLAHFVKGKDDEIARLNTDKGIIAMALKERGLNYQTLRCSQCGKYTTEPCPQDCIDCDDGKKDGFEMREARPRGGT